MYVNHVLPVNIFLKYICISGDSLYKFFVLKITGYDCIIGLHYRFICSVYQALGLGLLRLMKNKLQNILKDYNITI